MFYKKVVESPELIADDNTRLREIFHPNLHEVKANYSIAHVHLSVGEASLPHRIKSSETYYILQGSAKLYVNDEVQVMVKDSVAHVPANALQFIENISSDELIYLCIVEPAWSPSEE